MVDAMLAHRASDSWPWIHAHPNLAGRRDPQRATAASSAEQGGRRIDQCTPAELERFQGPERRVQEKVQLAVHPQQSRAGPWAEILAGFERRLGNPPEAEFEEAVNQIAQIALVRLDDLIRSLSRRAAATRRSCANSIAATVVVAEPDPERARDTPPDRRACAAPARVKARRRRRRRPWTAPAPAARPGGPRHRPCRQRFKLLGRRGPAAPLPGARGSLADLLGACGRAEQPVAPLRRPSPPGPAHRLHRSRRTREFSVPGRRPRSWPPPASSGSRRRLRRTYSAPMPLGPYSLCAERLSRSTPELPRRAEFAGALGGVGVQDDAALTAEGRAIPAMGLEDADLVVGGRRTEDQRPGPDERRGR